MGWVALGLPTVAEVLEIDALRRGRPSVLAGQGSLCHTVRWLHVSELSDVADLLRGGELVLTTGNALPTDPRALAGYVSDLASAGAAGLVVQHGRRFGRTLPGAMTRTADRRGLPLVSLAREVHYVHVTEAVHSRIINGHVEHLQTSEQLHAIFTELSLEGASVTEIVSEAARLSAVPVVLEDLSHRVVAFDSPTAEDVLAGWEHRSRTAVSTDRSAYHATTGLFCTRLAARGEEWGRLVLVCDEPPTTRQRMVAERAATTVALTQLIERDRTNLDRQAQRTLLGAIVEHRYNDAQLASRAVALGVPVAGRQLLGITVRPPLGWTALAPTDPHGGAPGSVVSAAADALTRAARRAHAAVLLGSLDERSVTGLVSLPPGADVDRALRHLIQPLWDHAAPREQTSPTTLPAIGVGFVSSDLTGARRSLTESHQVAQSLHPHADGPRYQRMADLGARGLLHLLRDDGRVQSYVEQQLGPLLAIAAQDDRLHSALVAYLAAGGNKKAAALSAHLSRAGLYERLARIESILGVDLDDPERRLSLHLALIALEEIRRGGETDIRPAERRPA